MSNQNMKFTETDTAILANHAPGVMARARIELAICRRLLHDLHSSGYTVKIDDGDTDEPVYNWDTALRTLFNLDEARLLVKKPGEHEKFISLVFGNDGYDLISDYTVSLEAVIDPINVWTDAAQDAGLCPVFDWEALNAEPDAEDTDIETLVSFVRYMSGERPWPTGFYPSEETRAEIAKAEAAAARLAERA